MRDALDVGEIRTLIVSALQRSRVPQMWKERSFPVPLLFKDHFGLNRGSWSLMTHWQWWWFIWPSLPGCHWGNIKILDDWDHSQWGKSPVQTWHWSRGDGYFGGDLSQASVGSTDCGSESSMWTGSHTSGHMRTAHLYPGSQGDDQQTASLCGEVYPEQPPQVACDPSLPERLNEASHDEEREPTCTIMSWSQTGTIIYLPQRLTYLRRGDVV